MADWGGYGWIIWVPEESDERIAQIPAVDMRTAIARAAKEGCVKIVFDCDAMKEDGLPYYGDGESAEAIAA